MSTKTVRTNRLPRQGFTLVELLLVMIIIGIVSAIAMPRFAQATARQQLDAAVNRLISDFEKAAHHAQATSHNVSIVFNTTTNRYTFTPTLGTSYVVKLDESPYQVSIVKASFAEATRVSFNGYGIPSSPGTVVLESSAGSVVISLAANGRASR